MLTPKDYLCGFIEFENSQKFMGNIVAIVGRPNVGKSTLFNRLTESRKAIVDEMSGVTRDRHYGKVEWNGKSFSIIDTGGYIENSDDIYEEEIKKQVILAIQEASVILFVVDVFTGVTDLDMNVAEMLRRSGKKVYLLTNKVDANEHRTYSYEFYSLGLGDPYCVSAMNGSGTGELLDSMVEHLEDDVEDEAPELPKFAIVGRPNVGKSSLLNALMGEERHIVTPIAGTTRDAIYTHYNKFGHDFLLVDTAGLRKKGKVEEDVEFYSVMRSIKTIENSDVCLFLLDAERGLEAQDMNIFNLIIKNRKGVVILVNKWDLIEKDNQSTERYTEFLRSKFAPFSDLPFVFTSATTKQRIFKAIELAMEVHQNRTAKIATRKLNDVMLPIIESIPPPAYKGKYVKIKFVNQLPTHSPSFAFYCNLPQYVREPYKRFLENQLRANFPLCGVPIQVFIRKK